MNPSNRKKKCPLLIILTFSYLPSAVAFIRPARFRCSLLHCLLNHRGPCFLILILLYNFNLGEVNKII